MARHLPLAPSPFGPLVEIPTALEDSFLDEEKLLQVGDIAKAVGKTVRALHHYEEVGLLRPHARSKGRYRLYDQNAVIRVRWIGKLHDLGLSLAQIQDIVRAWESAPTASNAMSRVRTTYAQKLEETRTQIAHLRELERELEASIDYLDTCDTCGPTPKGASGSLEHATAALRECNRCDLHDKTKQNEPELVAGIHGGQTRTSPRL